MKKIKSGFILPSAACNIKKNQIRFYDIKDKEPEVGDLVYGKILHVGSHKSLENQHGRIHTVSEGTKAIFIFGNRYAPDAYEGVVPKCFTNEIEMLARSGIIGEMRVKNTNSPDCTKVHIFGYVCDEDGNVINTRNFVNIKIKEEKPIKAKIILCVGSAMNSGKSLAAAKCCWALNAMGHNVNACKVTGTASLKDILLMEDCGAQNVADFTCLGYPSTYMLSEEEILNIFQTLDYKYASKQGYWVVEFADGIFQRETEMLLKSDVVRSRIHKLIYCAHDATGAIGGIWVLKNKFDLNPDGLSGYFSSSPLAVNETKEYVNLPYFDSMKNDLNEISKIILD